ncbi:GDSL-type esterase/lipase family protein [Hymenobacter caeli]|uniref:Lysophospholipase L1-like esterase n=1 Tax=Hymenobacter caeli TaxID=2735894 RepID=A0ABX2FUL4_9BACT|nr:GDSL-type esterase/lipase family protein [Hymenobacter caeli]NRT20877.1 lysophospholipase L1-like esterase [Hymenobacter caeli]
MLKTLLSVLAFCLLASRLVAQQVPGPAPVPAPAAPAPDPLRTDWANLARYAPANQQLPAPAAGKPRVVLMGNSITDGWPRADPPFFADPRYELVGRGIGGQTSPQMLLRFWQDVLDLHPAAVAIMAGINDIAENTGPYQPQATLNNLMAMAELAHAHGVRVILCSVMPAAEFPWRPGLGPGPKVVALNDQIKAYARQHRFVYLDYHAALVDDHLGMKAGLASDGVHPTLAGYRVMEPLLQQAVAEALKHKQ